MRAILIGGTGLIGSLLLEKLLHDPVFSRIKLISRRTTGIQHAKLEEAIINFEDAAAFKKEVSNADVLFCCIGTTQKQVKGNSEAYRKIDYDIPVNAAKFCTENGVGKFLIVSSVGANPSAGNFYLKLKGETEVAVLSFPIASIHIMRPSMLIGSRKESRPGEIFGIVLMKLFSVFLLGNISKYKAIKADDVAAAMHIAAKKTATGRFIYHYKEMIGLIKQTSE